MNVVIDVQGKNLNFYFLLSIIIVLKKTHLGKDKETLCGKSLRYLSCMSLNNINNDFDYNGYFSLLK